MKELREILDKIYRFSEKLLAKAWMTVEESETYVVLRIRLSSGFAGFRIMGFFARRRIKRLFKSFCTKEYLERFKAIAEMHQHPEVVFNRHESKKFWESIGSKTKKEKEKIFQAELFLVFKPELASKISFTEKNSLEEFLPKIQRQKFYALRDVNLVY